MSSNPVQNGSAGRRVVLVTGASSGIGAATALRFAAAGDIVYGLSRHPAELPGVLPLAADVTDEAQVMAAVAEIVAAQGRVDVLVNNAGFGISGAVEFTELEEAERQFDVNLFGMARCIRAALPHMREAKSGLILNVSSVAGALPIPFQAYYSAAKAAVNALTLTLQNELRPHGVRVAALLPGDVKTGFTAARRKNPAGAALYPALLRSVSAMERDEQNGMPPRRIAERLYAISKKKRPKGLYSCGLQYQFFLFLGKVLPVRLYNWIIGKLYA